MNSTKIENRMDTMFMSSRNSRTYDRHRLLLNLSDKMDLKRGGKYFALSNLSIYYIRKNIKKLCKNSKFKISTPTWFRVPLQSHGMKSLNYLMDYILYQIFKITLNIS